MISINPSNGEKIMEYAPYSQKEIEQILSEVHKSFVDWKESEFHFRQQCLQKLVQILRAEQSYLANLITEEMGKPITESFAEIEKCAWVCEYYAEHGASFLQDKTIQTEFSHSFVSYEPLGTILAVMPWNFPFWQVFRFLTPNLMAGNTSVLKHASNVTGCALKIEELVQKSGFPTHVFRTLVIQSSQVEYVIQHDSIQAVTLTGSEQAGSAVASIAGREIKKSVLELGGSDPFIVLDDANLDTCVHSAINARFLNAGQSCISAKRFIVSESILDTFVEKVTEKIQSLTIGDPKNSNTHIGPLAKPEFVDDLHQQVSESISMGATLVLGGQPISGHGFFYPPTLLRDCTEEMPVMNEETFGPVFSIISVKNVDEAITIANNSDLGLGACIWTENLEKGIQYAKQIESGAVFINDMTKSDPRLPFGGIKKSGYGRELSKEGIQEFVNIKTIVVK